MNRRDLLKAGALGGALGAASLMVPKIVSAQCDPITTDIEGPYYTANAPTRNVIIPEGAAGTKLFITGTVFYNDCETPVKAAKLDAWQADAAGVYDLEGYRFRGVFNTDDAGNYSFETILPGKYLNGANFRPRHIHFKINAPDGPKVTTQLYFEGDVDIPADQWASQEGAAPRTIPLTLDENEVLHGVFDINLRDVAPVTSVGESVRNGEARVLSINPQPLHTDGRVVIEVQQAAKVSLQIFDINGRSRATIFADWLDAGRHELNISNRDVRGLALNPGVHILQLLHGGVALDAKRFIVA